MKKPLLLLAAITLAPCGLLGACGGSKSAPSHAPSEAEQPRESAVAPAQPGPPVAPRAANAGSCPTSGLVDDFEDGNNRSAVIDGRGGYWYTYADPTSTVEPTGSFSPTEGGAEGSGFSGGMRGSVGSQQYPYVGMGVSFTEPKAPYDASCCTGLSFRAKKAGDGIANVRLKVGDWQTSPEGGACKSCFNDFGADFVFTDEWQQYSVSFVDLRQEPYWGEPKTALDPTALYQLQWQVKENMRPFDIRVDDVQLTGCGTSK